MDAYKIKKYESGECPEKIYIIVDGIKYVVK